jgi:hypothetical protein
LVVFWLILLLFEELPITDRFMFAMVFSHKEIAKRTRYYQAMCDSELLNKGEVYYNLKEQEPNKFDFSLALQNLLYSISTAMSPKNQSDRTWSISPPKSRFLRKQKTSTDW